jgi:ATP-binding cassette subfamily F protein 3
MLVGHGREDAAGPPEQQEPIRPKSTTKSAKQAKPDKSRKKPPKQRRFPYRKLSDIEDEIFERETCLDEMQRELLEPNVLRDGERVRQIKLQIEQEQAVIKTLYEHWEEASELNW